MRDWMGPWRDSSPAVPGGRRDRVPGRRGSGAPAGKTRAVSASLTSPRLPHVLHFPMSVPSLKTRQRLSEVRYEIRGELARRARELEGQGRHLIKLNIGNPGAFGFRAPEHLQRAIADHIAHTDPYSHQQ